MVEACDGRGGRKGGFLSRDNAGLWRLIIPIYPQGDERRGANGRHVDVRDTTTAQYRTRARKRGRMAGRLRSTPVRMLAVCLVYLFTLLGELSASCCGPPIFSFAPRPLPPSPYEISPQSLGMAPMGFIISLQRSLLTLSQSFIEKYIVRAGRNMNAHRIRAAISYKL